MNAVNKAIARQALHDAPDQSFFADLYHARVKQTETALDEIADYILWISKVNGSDIDYLEIARAVCQIEKRT